MPRLSVQSGHSCWWESHQKTFTLISSDTTVLQPTGFSLSTIIVHVRVCTYRRIDVTSGISLPSRNFPGGAGGKESICQCRRLKRPGFNPWVGKIPWRRAWQPTPAFLPGESHGQSCLADYRPCGHKESDMT